MDDSDKKDAKKPSGDALMALAGLLMLAALLVWPFARVVGLLP